MTNKLIFIVTVIVIVDNISMFNLTDYNLVSLPRSCCGHGGLIIYVHNQFKCTTINHKIMKRATD